MADGEITLPSGAKLAVTEADFDDAQALFEAIMSTMRGADLPPALLELDTDVLADPEKTKAAAANAGLVGAVMDKALAVATSPAVKAALYRCFEKAVYQNVRLTRAAFNDPKISGSFRRDYLAIAAKVIEVNCAPFFESTSFALKTLLGMAAQSQK